MSRFRFSVNDLEGLSNEELLRNSYVREKQEVTEPYDPEYLSDEKYEIPDVSSYEKRFYRKVSIVENKLRKNNIKFTWMERYEMFRVSKLRQDEDGNVSGYPTHQYIAIYMDTNEYAFGGMEEDRCVSTRISDVIASVKEWLFNNEPGLK